MKGLVNVSIQPSHLLAELSPFPLRFVFCRENMDFHRLKATTYSPLKKAKWSKLLRFPRLIRWEFHDGFHFFPISFHRHRWSMTYSIEKLRPLPQFHLGKSRAERQRYEFVITAS